MSSEDPGEDLVKRAFELHGLTWAEAPMPNTREGAATQPVTKSARAYRAQILRMLIKDPDVDGVDVADQLGIRRAAVSNYTGRFAKHLGHSGLSAFRAALKPDPKARAAAEAYADELGD